MPMIGFKFFFRKAGLKLVLTVNPFVSTMSPNFAYGVKEQLFVLERTNASSIHVPALTWFKVNLINSFNILRYN